MAEWFKIAFEQVQLLSGLGPDQPVWLFVRATLHNEADLDTALETQQVGSLPPDANRPLGPGFPQGIEGLYAPGLAVGAIVRNDIPNSSTGQIFPRFELNAIAVDAGQILAVEVIMVPKVWIKTIRVPQSEADKWAKRAFTTILGSAGLGVWGALGGAIIGFFWGDEDQDVEVPCFQTIVTARHIFTLDDLRALQSEGMRQFGPADNDMSEVCGAIDSFYWLSANQHQPYSFGTVAPIDPSDCQLRPWRHRPVDDWLTGTWLDRDTWDTSCMGVSVHVTDDNTADVWVFDEPQNPAVQPREFRRCPITSDWPPNAFTINWYGDGCPPRTVSPTCPNCKRFTNTPSGLGMSGLMLVALALGSRHGGAEAWVHALVAPDSALKLPSCSEAERLKRIAVDAQDEPRPFAKGVLFKRWQNDGIALWPKGTPPPKPPPPPDLPRPPALERFGDIGEISGIVEALYGCFKVRIGEREALFTYAEVPARGEPMCARLRYVRWDETQTIIKDVMLSRWIRPPR